MPQDFLQDRGIFGVLGKATDSSGFSARLQTPQVFGQGCRTLRTLDKATRLQNPQDFRQGYKAAEPSGLSTRLQGCRTLRTLFCDRAADLLSTADRSSHRTQKAWRSFIPLFGIAGENVGPKAPIALDQTRDISVFHGASL